MEKKVELPVDESSNVQNKGVTENRLECSNKAVTLRRARFVRFIKLKEA